MHIEVKINQAESVRRGINAPASIVKLEVDVSGLEQKYRDYIATYLRDGFRLWSAFANHDYPKELPEPTVKGLLEMIDKQLEIIDGEKAKKAAEELRRQQRGEEVLASIRVNPAEFVKTSRTYPDALYDFFIHGVDHNFTNIGSLPEPERKIATDYALSVIEKAASAKAVDEKEQKRKQDEAVAATIEQDKRTLSLLDEEEREMQEAGLLSLAQVRDRLDEAAVKSLLARIEVAAECEWGVALRDQLPPATREQFRFLKAIKAAAGDLPCRLVAGDYYNTRNVQVDVRTDDGRVVIAKFLPSAD